MHSEAEALEHMKKRHTGHQSVSLKNKTGDSTVLKIGDSGKVVIKQDMKGGEHKYGFNNNKREKSEKVRVVDDETGDKHELFEFLRMIMASPPASPPLPPPPPSPPSAPSDASASPSAMKRTRKASRLRSLSTRPPGAERPVVHVDPATGKADGPHRKKLRTYLGIVARDKVDVTYKNEKVVPTAQKNLIWEDIQVEFEIPEASDSRTKRKLLQTVGERWRQFKSDLTRKWALAANQDGAEDTTRRDPSWEDVHKKAQAIQKQNTAPHVLSRGGSVDGIIDPPSPVSGHVKWKMARTKKTGEMTIEATKEIVAKIATQGSFVPHGRQDVPVATIGRPEHPGRVRAAGAGVTIKQYFGSAPRTSHSSSSLPPKELQQLTQQIRDQLEESITERSRIQSQMQSQGLALPPEPLVSPSDPRVSTKGSCVNPSRNDPETDPARLVALGRVYEGSTVVHNTPLFPGQVKVGVEEVTDADAPVPVPTDEVSLVGQALHTFLAWPTHLVAVSPAKPPPKPDPEVDDPLYLMTLTIPELFLRPYQVTWDGTVFGVFNPDFPLYIKHEDLSEIAHGGQCLSISHLTETCMRAGNSDIYGFLEPQSIQSRHWQMVVILPKEHLNNALKGLDDAPQPKSKAPARWIVFKCNRQKGSTECGYYVMHWMSNIILGTFRNNWEARHPPKIWKLPNTIKDVPALTLSKWFSVEVINTKAHKSESEVTMINTCNWLKLVELGDLSRTELLENEELHFAKGKKEEREAAHLFTLVLIAETGIARHLRKDPNNNTIRKLKLKNTNPSSYEVSLFRHQFSCLRQVFFGFFPEISDLGHSLLDTFSSFHLHVLILKNKEYAIDYYRCGFAISGLYMVSGLVSVSSMEDIQLDISWDDVACPICLDFPHNSVLLHCSSYDKGCRAFVCDTNQLHSNCLDRFKNSCGMPSSPVSNATSAETTENSDDHEVSNGQCNLTCPLCRGEVSGWVIVDKARIHLDEKKRCCDEVRCTFMGSYLELQEHAQLEHPHARPSKIDPARQLDWENFQQSSEIIDVLSTIHSEIPRGVVLGDYVIEYGDDDARDEFEDFPGDEGNWWTSCILYFDNFRRSRNRRTRVSRTGRDNRRLSYDTSNSDEGSVVSMEYADYRIEEIDDDFVSTSGSSRGSSDPIDAVPAFMTISGQAHAPVPENKEKKNPSPCDYDLLETPNAPQLYKIEHKVRKVNLEANAALTDIFSGDDRDVLRPQL
ncbi:hypothetical protein HKD37_14G040107 [Glycine soja]